MAVSRIVPLAFVTVVAVAGAAAPLLVLHVALGHAMRARGHPRWRLRDTALVSPLLAGGLFVGFGALGLAVARPSAAAIAAAAAAFVVAGFGARAVGKLY